MTGVRVGRAGPIWHTAARGDATAVTAAQHPGRTPAHPNKMAVGTIVWLVSELMFFAALFAMYFTVRAVTSPDLGRPRTCTSTSRSPGVNTLVLVSSSLTCQLGVFAAERGDVKGLRRWFVITYLMGAFFVAGQIFEYPKLVHEGLTLSSPRTARSST